MSTPTSRPIVPASRSLVIMAFAAIYVFWGSTYLSIRFAIETIPPFLMAGSRFLFAGALLYWVARLRHHARPTLRQWRHAAVVGCLLLAVGNGSVTYVEQTVPSTIVAFIIALTPVWMALIDWLRGGPKPGVWTQFGLALGIAGVALIITPGGGGSLTPGHALGITILLASTMSWAYGSVWSRQADKPSSAFLTVGMQMTAAGVALLLVGLVCGEGRQFHPGSFSAKSLLAWFYLFSAGSVIGFTAYIWLLQVTTTARVSTHCYVNPVIAVVLGVWLGRESISSHAVIGGGLIVMAVVMILRAPKVEPGQAALRPSTLPISTNPARPVVE